MTEGVFASPSKPRVRYRANEGFYRVLHWVENGEVNPANTALYGPWPTLTEAVSQRMMSYRPEGD